MGKLFFFINLINSIQIKEIYSLRYEEFIALNTHMIQKQQTEIDSLKKEIQELKEMILSL